MFVCESKQLSESRNLEEKKHTKHYSNQLPFEKNVHSIHVSYTALNMIINGILMYKRMLTDTGFPHNYRARKVKNCE